MDMKLIYATLINLLGKILFITTLGTSKLLSIIFPMLTYFIAWKYFNKLFWKSYIYSIIILVVLIFGFIFGVALTPYKTEVYRAIFSYIRTVTTFSY